MSEPNEQIKALGKDLHYLGVANSVEIPTKLYEMGWRKNPRPTIAPQVIPASVVQPLTQQVSTQLANPNHIIPRRQRWMQ